MVAEYELVFVIVIVDTGHGIVAGRPAWRHNTFATARKLKMFHNWFSLLVDGQQISIDVHLFAHRLDAKWEVLMILAWQMRVSKRECDRKKVVTFHFGNNHRCMLLTGTPLLARPVDTCCRRWLSLARYYRPFALFSGESTAFDSGTAHFRCHQTEPRFSPRSHHQTNARTCSGSMTKLP